MCKTFFLHIFGTSKKKKKVLWKRIHGTCLIIFCMINYFWSNSFITNKNKHQAQWCTEPFGPGAPGFVTLFPSEYFRSTLSASDRSPEREREGGWVGRVYVPRFPYACLVWVSFFSCQLLASSLPRLVDLCSLPNWASGVGCFRCGCWCMGRGPVLRETCLGLRYITVSCMISVLCILGRDPVWRESFSILS